MLIEQMLDQLETMGKRRSPRIIWQSVLYYYGSIMLNKYNLRKSIGSKSVIRYYSIIFGSSGIGKDYILNTIEKMCKLDNYAKAMNNIFENHISNLPESLSDADIDEVRRYMPKSVTIGLEGTSEGLFSVIQAQNTSGFGSINLSSSEFGESITSSSQMLSRLKELYDTQFKAKIIKGDNETSMKPDINNIICNFIGLGSRKGITSESEKELHRLVSSGMFRRTFIIDSKEPVSKNTTEQNTKQLEEYLDALNEQFKADYLIRSNLDPYNERFFEYSDDYEEYIDKIDDDLILTAQQNQLDEFAQYNTGSLEIIIDLSHIIAFLEWDTTVTSEHAKKAYEFMKQTRTTVEETFRTIHPYKLMYDLLKLKKNMTISEMAEFEQAIPITKTKVTDNIALLEELCYRNDEILVQNQGKVTRYAIEPLPLNKLDKLIVSVDLEHKGKFATNYMPLEIPFFGEKPSIEQLVVSDKVDSFCACHFEPSKSNPDGHRRKENFISGENMIIFDFDEGLTIEEAKVIFQQYTYILYTTSSHSPEQDKFRVILPTKNTFYVEPEQHKKLYENIAMTLSIPIYDKSCVNAGRLFFTQEGKDREKKNTYQKLVLTNKAELLDATSYMPDTIKSDTIMPKIEAVNEEIEDGELSKREAGYIKWALTQGIIKSERNTKLYMAAMFFKDLGSTDPIHLVERLNNLIMEPLDDKEIKNICRSAGIL